MVVISVELELTCESMRKTDVIKHFGSVIEVARALQISRAAVSKWPPVIPEGSAYKVESITKGKLKVDPGAYPPLTKEPQAHCA